MRLLPRSATADARRILLGRSLRAFGDGFVSVLLAAYLQALGFDAASVGAVSTATLLGSALCTLGLGLAAHRLPLRLTLLGATLLMAGTGIAFGALNTFWPLMVVAFVGTLNPSSGDVSLFLPLEHTVLAQSVAAQERTAIFTQYAFAGAVVGAFGSLAAGVVDMPGLAQQRMAALQAMFVLYGLLGVAVFALYRRLSPAVDFRPAEYGSALGPSRWRVYGLAALFSVDAFGGGFIINALLALWLFQRFGLAVATAGTIFFATGLCQAISFLVAERLARRFGLIRTMVFSHLPANVLLVLAALMPNAWLAAGLLVVRSLLSSMDVPTRTSYVMAVVTPPERPAAASLTAVPRSLAAAGGPALAGWLLTVSSFGWPLVIGGALKIVYDLVLLRQFSRVKPPEEA